MKTLIVFILFLAALGGGAYYRVHQLRNQPEIKGIDEIQTAAGLPVRVYECRAETAEETFEASGAIAPLQSADIAPELAGRLARLHVATGVRVKRGDGLVSLDDTTAQLALRQAEAGLNQARQTLDKLRNGSRPEEIALARAQLEQARADLDLKELEQARFAKLYQEQATTLQMKQQTGAAAAAAAALYRAAQAAHDLAVAGPRAEDLALAQIAVDQAQTAVEQARDHLDDHTLKAPFDGVVTRNRLDEGDIVDFKQVIFSVMQIDRVYIETEVSELHIARIAVGMPTTVRVDALPDDSFPGTVADINPASTGQNRSYQVRIELDNADGRLRPGSFARARFVVNRLDHVLLVPDDAVREENGASFVLAVNAESRVDAVPVKKGLLIGDRVLIESGLTPGMKLVTLGLNVKPGSLVTIVE